MWFSTRNKYFILLVGDNSDVIVWSLSNGHIIKVISGYPVMSCPLINYTHHIGGPDGPPALLVAIGNQLTVHTLYDTDFKLK